jgi:glycosyltransferase involved in cell wall biosynthesis
MKNKKVLVITPFFAPETHAAVFRAHKLVKYLKKEGWEPIVITVDINYIYNEDLNLLDELKDIPVYHTMYIEPTLRGLKMWITGKDRTYKTLKKQQSEITNKTEINKTLVENKSFFQKVYNYCLNHYLKKPDRFWTWKKSAIKKAEQLIKEENIGVVYTTCLPFTTNQIGIALKKSTGVKWVADFRDPVTYAKRMYSSIPHIYKKQKSIQDETFKFADHITVLSSSYKSIFYDQYEGLYNDKISFIPTGLDDDYIPEEQKIENSIVFVGEYLKEYKDYFFKIFLKVLEVLPDNQRPILKIIGNKDINEKQALPFVKLLHLEENIVFLDHMPQQQLYIEIKRAKCGLLIPGMNSLWWTNFAKMVDYIALQKPVISLVPNISEARSELEKANLGIFLGEDENENVELLHKYFALDNFDVQPNKDFCERYLASKQVEAFIEVFKKL